MEKHKLNLITAIKTQNTKQSESEKEIHWTEEKTVCVCVCENKVFQMNFGVHFSSFQRIFSQHIQKRNEKQNVQSPYSL